MGLDLGSATFEKYGFLAAVADGMGGYQGGGFASRLVLETLAARFYDERREGITASALREQVAEYIKAANDVLAKSAFRSPELSEAGTTLAGLAFAVPNIVVVFHAGDSRILRVRAGYVLRLTQDHSVVGTALDAGRLSEEQALNVKGGRGLTKVISSSDAAEPDYEIDKSFSVGDSYLICSDGLHGLGSGIDEGAIGLTLSRDIPAKKKLASLIEQARNIDGTDNITGVLVECIE